MTLPPRTTRRRKAKGVPDEVRAEVVRRSRGMCEVCGIRRGEHLHHRKMRSQGGEHTAANLLHVDHQCHQDIHQNPLHSYENGWLVRSWDDG